MKASEISRDGTSRFIKGNKVELKDKIIDAGKWSTITELCAKLIAPVSNIVLARVLTPEAFGVVATVTMITSFAEIFTDAGFQKYIIQHEFTDEKSLYRGATVAFWSNLVFSVFIWVVIAIFQSPLAALVGNPGLGHVITIASLSILLIAFSSIQTALYKRSFDFKTLFKVRAVSIFIPLVVTVPLAFILKSYWALILGTIASNAVNAVLLTYYSEWKPKLYYSWAEFKKMFSFSFWTMCEAVTIWLTNYADIFIIGIYLSEYYLGLYKTSMTTVGQVVGLITGITNPILFSSLSRVQNDREKFKELFFKFQRAVAVFIFPLGVMFLCFPQMFVEILLGSQWLETCKFIGLWGMTSALTIVFAHYSSEAYRSIGKPKLSVLAQVLHIVVLCPAIIIAVKYGFEVLYITRSLVRLELVLVNVVLMSVFVKIGFIEMCGNCKYPFMCSVGMFAVATLFNSLLDASVWTMILNITISCVFYVVLINRFPQERKVIRMVLSRVPILNRYIN